MLKRQIYPIASFRALFLVPPFFPLPRSSPTDRLPDSCDSPCVRLGCKLTVTAGSSPREMVTDGVLAGLSYPKFCIVSIGHLGVRYLGQGG